MIPVVAKRKHVPNVIAPDEQERVLAAIPEADSGSRYIPRGETVGWGQRRQLMHLLWRLLDLYGGYAGLSNQDKFA
jgi:hypothetical protein